MEPFSSSSSIGTSGFERLSDEFSLNFGFEGTARNGPFSNSSLVLDRERGELVEAAVKLQRKGVSVERSTTALKNHCEAERRRRARINAHLDTLRNLLPGAKKMDKASLLGEVVSHLKELKKNAEEACKGILIPMDNDEVRVEKQDLLSDGASFLFWASLSCNYQPGILSDLRQALDSLHLILVRAEVATLEGRMKNNFLLATCKERETVDTEVYQVASSLDQAFRSVLDKFSDEFSLRATLPNKRQRVSLLNSTLSSSSSELW